MDKDFIFLRFNLYKIVYICKLLILVTQSSMLSGYVVNMFPRGGHYM